MPQQEQGVREVSGRPPAPPQRITALFCEGCGYETIDAWMHYCPSCRSPLASVFYERRPDDSLRMPLPQHLSAGPVEFRADYMKIKVTKLVIEGDTVYAQIEASQGANCEPEPLELSGDIVKVWEGQIFAGDQLQIPVKNTLTVT